jgi:hypothetical protein
MIGSSIAMGAYAAAQADQKLQSWTGQAYDYLFGDQE